MTKEEKETYDYVLDNCEVHWMPNKSLYTAHITLGIDYQKYGNSEWEAKDTLAFCLCRGASVREMVAAIKTPITK